MKRQKIGLFGGSFNPVHCGHLHIARQAIKRLCLDQLWILVCKHNPLKKVNYESGCSRVEKIKDLIGLDKKIKAFYIGDIYTYKTIRLLKLKLPSVRFFWIMGMDSAENFHLWERWYQIAESVEIAVFSRGYSRINRKVRSKVFLRFKCIHKFFIKTYDISSTEIRGAGRNS